MITIRKFKAPESRKERFDQAVENGIWIIVLVLIVAKCVHEVLIRI